jgi:Zn-dependent peptidase ImmA (M78 family)
MSSAQQKAEERAAALLERFQIDKAPVPVAKIAEELGIEIQSQPGSPDISGLLFREDGRVVIGLNADDSPLRQRFTIAHELGHYELHDGSSEELHIDRGLRTTLLRAPTLQQRGGIEREANWFAAALLMPEQLVRDVATAISEGRRPSDDNLVAATAEEFEVSRQAMSYRLMNLGLLSGL